MGDLVKTIGAVIATAMPGIQKALSESIQEHTASSKEVQDAKNAIIQHIDDAHGKVHDKLDIIQATTDSTGEVTEELNESMKELRKSMMDISYQIDVITKETSNSNPESLVEIRQAIVNLAKCINETGKSDHMIALLQQNIVNLVTRVERLAGSFQDVSEIMKTGVATGTGRGSRVTRASTGKAVTRQVLYAALLGDPQWAKKQFELYNMWELFITSDITTKCYTTKGKSGYPSGIGEFWVDTTLRSWKSTAKALLTAFFNSNHRNERQEINDFLAALNDIIKRRGQKVGSTIEPEEAIEIAKIKEAEEAEEAKDDLTIDSDESDAESVAESVADSTVDEPVTPKVTPKAVPKTKVASKAAPKVKVAPKTTLKSTSRATSSLLTRGRPSRRLTAKK